MNKADYIELGYISKAHGIRGELKAVFDVYDIGEYKNKKELYLAKGDKPIEIYLVKKFNITPKKIVIIAFEGIDDRNQSEELVGSTIYFPQADLPQLKDGHFYYFQIEGFQVEDKQLGSLGKVVTVIDGPAHDILVMNYKHKEVLIPMTDEFVLQADMETKVLHTNLPDGLVDAYIN